ncbi:MAG: hypothetical protein V1663_01270 [archaeon]
MNIIKKSLFILILLILIFSINGCVKTVECYEQDESCCIKDGEKETCISEEILCIEGSQQKFLGCNFKDCKPKYECENINSESELPEDYTLTSSEGYCYQEEDCIYAGDSCGGGHGFCTSDPDKYADIVTTCEIVPEHPSNKGYVCSCIKALSTCGWVK